jgi:hypothetical protein
MMPAELIFSCSDRGVDAWPDGHYVHLHGPDDRALVRDVARYVGEGLAGGETAVVVAGPRHRKALAADLGVAAGAAIDGGLLEFLDADEMLARFMVRGYPDAERFDSVIGELVRDARARGRLRAYGEMVGILWQSEQYPAAIRLEQLWNKLRRDVNFSLYCGYPIDVFGDAFQPGMVEALLCAHTHLLPASGTSVEWAVSSAIDDMLGLPADEVRRRVRSDDRKSAWDGMPMGESMILWLRSNHTARANEVLAQARNYYYKLSA